jgi:hypothetical protein
MCYYLYNGYGDKGCFSRKASGTMPRKASSSARPLGFVPLEWKKWPDPSVPLVIEDLDGRYSFVCPSPHGSYDAIRVRRWEERDNPMAVQFVVGIERVLVPGAAASGKSRATTREAAQSHAHVAQHIA